jgi:DNA uptake protein ComE-like DNA-binding protein
MKRRAEDGFALLAALVMVAVVAVVGAIVGAWIVRSLDRSASLQERLAADAAVIDAVRRVSWVLVSGRFSERGLEPSSAGNAGPAIALDDRPYRLGNTVVRLQDCRGLFNLNGKDAKGLDALLGGYGLPGSERTALDEALSAYIARAATAEPSASVPPGQGQAGPRTKSLMTPWEPRRLPEWDALAVLWSGAAALPRLTDAGSSSGLNVNTAPLPVLLTVPGMSDAAAQAVIAYRAGHPFKSAADLQSAGGLAGNADMQHLLTFPADSLRLQVVAAGDPLLHVLTITVTPAAQQPYRINYAVDLPQSAADRALLIDPTIPPLPGVEN